MFAMSITMLSMYDGVGIAPEIVIVRLVVFTEQLVPVT